MKEKKSAELDALIDGAEELLIKLADAYDPGIQMLRDRIDHAIADARRSMERQDSPTSERLRHVAGTVDDFVRNHPWTALAAGALAVGTVAYFVGAAIGGKERSARDRL
jgi:ElaB/YqjD/DUF883 family membrane-anchored ribosome-binding protein